MEMMLNPWIFGLEAMQRGWQAQSALAFRLMRSLAGGTPDQTRFSPSIPGSVDVDIKAQEEVAANPDARKTPAAINRRAGGACRNCRCATSQSPKGFAGRQGDISREAPDRIKTGGRGWPEFRVKSGGT
jgi:hypothetical protein